MTRLSRDVEQWNDSSLSLQISVNDVRFLVIPDYASGFQAVCSQHLSSRLYTGVAFIDRRMALRHHAGTAHPCMPR